MRINSGRVVVVNSMSFPVQEQMDLLRADMHGLFGWTSVWAPRTLEVSEYGEVVDVTFEVLYQRIKKALAEGAFGAPTGAR